MSSLDVEQLCQSSLKVGRIAVHDHLRGKTKDELPAEKTCGILIFQFVLHLEI